MVLQTKDFIIASLPDEVKWKRDVLLLGDRQETVLHLNSVAWRA